jgi:hypothetical protein
LDAEDLYELGFLTHVGEEQTADTLCDALAHSSSSGSSSGGGGGSSSGSAAHRDALGHSAFAAQGGAIEDMLEVCVDFFSFLFFSFLFSSPFCTSAVNKTQK